MAWLVRVSNYMAQERAAYELMARQKAYAASIGCTTYEDGPMHDSIEVHSPEQTRLLETWWAENTKPILRDADPRGGGSFPVG